ncbi:hypothetical protein [Aurantiacibacter flavus]|uniref:Uncharacterized protein n=1 Tax=Aurantiacibacter flavus TaxID=3145232 RepID=A0ABV0CZK4_9SPHN
MIRRDMLKWGALASAMAGAPAVALAKAGEGLDVLLLDTRFGDGTTGEMGAARVLTFAGDVTRIWYDHLDCAWRRPGFVVGGITGADALFVLETLAHQQGRKVVARNPLAAVDGVTPVRWVIAPVHPSVLA